MEDPTVLLNIIREAKSNIRIILYLAQKGNQGESVHEEFHSLRNNSVVLPEQALEKCNETWSRIGRTLVKFVDIISRIIQDGEKIYHSFTPNLQSIQHLKMTSCDRVCKVKDEMEAVQQSWDDERKARLDLIEHVRFRIQRLRGKSSEALRLARECGDATTNEMRRNSEAPIRERQLNVTLLVGRLSNLKKENGVVEEQLERCRLDLIMEIEELQAKLKNDVEARLRKSAELVQETQDKAQELATLQVELAEVTTHYDIIMARRQKEEAERRRLQEIRIRRECAAVKLQRWYRSYLLQRVGRRRRKKGKAKTSTSGLKFQVLTTSKEDVRSSAKISDVEKPVLVDNRPISPVISTVSSSNIPSPLPEDKPSTALTSRSTHPRRSITSPIKRITVLAAVGSTEKEDTGEDVLGDLPGTSSRAAQTDNRVPKTRQLYRQQSQHH